MKKENKRKTQKIRYFVRNWSITLYVLIGVALTLIVISTIFLFLNYDKLVFLILLIVSSIILLSSITILFIYLGKMKAITYKNLYQRTISNLENIEHYNFELAKYDVEKFNEFDELNNVIKHIQYNYDDIIIASVIKKYDDYGFSYLREFGNLEVIRAHDLVDQIPSLLNTSRTYRNLFFSIKFDNPDNIEITDEHKIKLVYLIKKIFNINNPLISYSEKHNFFLVFVPNIDSLSIIKEKFEYISSNFILADYNVQTKICNLIISAVMYPYSSMKDVMTHLRYAERKGEFINFYIPSIVDKSFSKNKLYSEKIGDYNKLLDIFSYFKTRKLNSSAYLDVMSQCIKNVANLIDFDCGGIVSKNFDNSDFTIRNSWMSEHVKDKVLAANIFSYELCEAIKECSDMDGTYVFYNSFDTNIKLRKIFDIYSISSGYFYLIYREGEFLGLLYFFNFNDKTFVLDNYTREFLLYYSNMISTFFLEYADIINLNYYKKNLDTLLTFTNFKEYSVNNLNYRIVSLSNEFAEIKKDVHIGDLCYQAIYGLKEPCANCPLKRFKKKTITLDNVNYSYNLVNNKDNKKISTFFLSPIKENVEDAFFRSRFDQETLLSTTFSLIEELNNKFNLKTKGYLMLIKFESRDELIKRYKEEGYNDALINISSSIKETIKGVKEVYLYQNDTFALILSEFTRSEVFSMAEKIERIFANYVYKYALTVDLNRTMYVYSYPLAYPSIYDFLRNIEKDYSKQEKDMNNNLIFRDENIIRTQNRESYILSLLNDSFNKRSFDIRILPLIKKKSGSLFGGEILLRLEDSLTNIFIDAYEFIDVAIKNNKMNLFTNLIIEQIGKIYSTYGQTLFRNGCLDRLSINVDSSYFNDGNFINEIGGLLTSYNFNKGFLAFEVNEQDISNHKELFKEVIKKLSSYSVSFIVDQFSGKFMSFSDIKRLGFDEVKIDRNIIKDIDIDPVKLNEVKEMCNDAKDAQIKISVIGIERKEQIGLLKDIDNIEFMQGYYFYKPLEVDEFISLVKTFNLKIPLN